MRIAPASVAVLIFVCMMNAGAQSIYKWVDENGVTHFSQQRPQGIDSERTNIRVESGSRRSWSSSEFREAAADNSAEPAVEEQKTTAANRMKERREKAAAEKTQAAQERKTRSENCTQARQRLEKYEASRRLYYERDDGDRQYLDDSELDEARAEARQSVTEWCG